MLPKGNLGDQHDNWDGWNLTSDGFLIDPAGNKYLPSHLIETFYGRQLYRSMAGTSFRIRCLKEALEKKLKKMPATIVQITYVDQGGQKRKKRVELS